MSPALRRINLLAVAVLCFLLQPVEVRAESLLVVGHEDADADLVAVDENGLLTFRVNEQDQQVAIEDFVRWSNRLSHGDASEITLVDGSRLAIAKSWTKKPSWSLNEQNITATTRLFGSVEIPRESVRAIVVNGPEQQSTRQRFLDRLLSAKHAKHGLQLVNGDRWSGEQLSVIDEKESRQFQLSSDMFAQPMNFSVDQVAAVILPSRAVDVQSHAKLIVGMRDGSLLFVESLVVDADKFTAKTGCGLQLVGGKLRDVAFLQSLVAKCQYLSDLDTLEFRHQPYLDISWLLQRDRNVLGGPLVVSDKRYAKGIGVLTASRITCKLPTEDDAQRYQRFRCSVAVDAAAGKRGSVVFRVYLKQSDQWREAFASPVIRGGEPPIPVSVELEAATALALVADFADRGDELDYANWFDARLE